jgi:hypothetical protein
MHESRLASGRNPNCRESRGCVPQIGHAEGKSIAWINLIYGADRSLQAAEIVGRGAIYEGMDRSAVSALRPGVEDIAAVANSVFLALKKFRHVYHRQ